MPFGSTVMSVVRYFSNIPSLIKIGITGLESSLLNSFRTPDSLLISKYTSLVGVVSCPTLILWY